jgi:hypothetical protein
VRAVCWNGLGDTLLSASWGEVEEKPKKDSAFDETNDNFDDHFDFDEPLDLHIHENFAF